MSRLVGPPGLTHPACPQPPPAQLPHPACCTPSHPHMPVSHNMTQNNLKASPEKGPVHKKSIMRTESWSMWSRRRDTFCDQALCVTNMLKSDEGQSMTMLFHSQIAQKNCLLLNPKNMKSSLLTLSCLERIWRVGKWFHELAYHWQNT